MVVRRREDHQLTTFVHYRLIPPPVPLLNDPPPNLQNQIVADQVRTEGIYRIDTDSNKDLNVWEFPSLKRKRAAQDIEFDIRYGRGEIEPDGRRFCRMVVRRRA